MDEYDRKLFMTRDSKKTLLLLLYARGPNIELGEPIVGVSKITKILFMLHGLFKNCHLRETFWGDDPDFNYKFEKGKYGPYCAQIYEDIMSYEGIGFIQVKESKEPKIVESYHEWQRWMDDGTLDLVPRVEDLSLFDTERLFEDEISLTKAGMESTETLYRCMDDPVELK